MLTARGAFESFYGRHAFALDASRAIYRPARLEHHDFYPFETACITIRLPFRAPRSSAVALADSDLPSATRRLWNELDARDTAAAIVIESLSAEIVARVASRPEWERSKPLWIRRVRERLDEEYADLPTLRAIADDAGHDVSHVATTFRKTYGKSIGTYARDVRIWRTRRLLEDPAICLAEIAAIAGFADQSHFTRLFKRRFAITPAQYRKRCRN